MGGRPSPSRTTRWAASSCSVVFFFFQAEDGIRDADVTGVQTCALPIFKGGLWEATRRSCLTWTARLWTAFTSTFWPGARLWKKQESNWPYGASTVVSE